MRKGSSSRVVAPLCKATVRRLLSVTREFSPDPNHTGTSISNSELQNYIYIYILLLLKSSSPWYFAMEAWTTIPLRVKAKVSPTARGLTHFPRPATLTLLPLLLSPHTARHAISCQAYSHFGGLCFLYLEQIAPKYLHNILSHSKVTSMMSS